MLELLFEHEKHDAIIVSSKMFMLVLDVDKNGLNRTLTEVFNEIRLFLDRLKSHLYSANLCMTKIYYKTSEA